MATDSANNNRITTAFNRDSTAADVVKGIDLKGKRAIVTGGASGIGVETARALAGAGADVTIACRDVKAGEKIAEEIKNSTGNGKVSVAPLDLSVRSSIGSFVSAWSGPLHILVNNAGIMASPELRTAEGWEMQFATNHVGHFALATGLHKALAAARGARVVSVSSTAHLSGGVDFDDIHFSKGRKYEKWTAYGQSKSANVLFAVEGNKRWAKDGITVNALHPGAIRTNLQRHVSMEELDALRTAVKAQWHFKTPEQGAATSVLVATAPALEGVGGKYFEDCNEAEPHVPGGPRKGVAAHALDPVAAARLWTTTEQMLT